MTLRDIAFWIRSARADAALARHLANGTASEAFDRLYGSTDDPYGSALPQFRYQRRKYRALLSMLPNRAYGNVLDVGCGLGVFTRMLAPYADRVVGLDLSAEAVAQARKLAAGLSNVTYAQADIESFDHSSRYSLVVVADVIYYLTALDDASVRRIAADLTRFVEPGGLLLLVNHFFFGFDGQSKQTRRIHDVFSTSPGLVVADERRRAFYLATLFERR